MNLFTFKKAAGLLCLLLLASCHRFKTVDVQAAVANPAKHADDTIMQAAGAPGYFSRLRVPGTFGLYVDCNVPEKSQDHLLYVVISGRIRSNYAQSNALIVLAPRHEQEQVGWMVMPLKPHFIDVNQWSYFRDSIRIEPQLEHKTCTSIRVMAHLVNSTKEIFDLDTLHVSLLQKL